MFVLEMPEKEVSVVFGRDFDVTMEVRGHVSVNSVSRDVAGEAVLTLRAS
jgi:hypothetical protein